MKAGKANPSLNLDEDKRTDEVVAHKLGIGGKDTYRKEKLFLITALPSHQRILQIGMRESCQRIRRIHFVLDFSTFR